MKKKKIILLLIVFNLMLWSVCAYDLRDYPFPFVEDDEVNTMVIIGDNASYLDKSSAVDLIIGLGYDFLLRKGIYNSEPEAPKLPFRYGSKPKLDKDVLDISTRNIITIGGPCANKITAEIMELPTTWQECATGFEDGNGRIILYNKWNKSQLVIAGYSAVDTRSIIKILTQYTEYNFSGKHFEVSSKTNTLI